MRKVYLLKTQVEHLDNGARREKRAPGFFALPDDEAERLIAAGEAKPATDDNQIIKEIEPGGVGPPPRPAPVVASIGLISDNGEEADDGTD